MTDKIIKFPKTKGGKPDLKVIQGDKQSLEPLHVGLAREFAVTTALLSAGLDSAAAEHAHIFIRLVRELRIREINDPQYDTPEAEYGRADELLPTADDLERGPKDTA